MQNTKKEKHPAYSLTNILAIVVMACLCCLSINFMHKFKETPEEAFLKSGIKIKQKLKNKTRKILSKHSHDKRTFSYLKFRKGGFKIGDFDANKNINLIYRSAFFGSTVKVPTPQYLLLPLKDENGPLKENLNIKYFNVGFFFGTENSSYMAVKLNENCKVTETFVYDPTKPQSKERYSSCGLIFYDVNGESEPNTLGVDQFTYSIDLFGVQ